MKGDFAGFTCRVSLTPTTTAMPLWDKLKSELDRAGRAAQNALDEGRIQLDAFRARQRMDKAAQALGYAVHRAKAAGAELDTESYGRLSAELAEREAEVQRLEAELREARAFNGAKVETGPTPPADTPLV
jgi:hypothetical protein